MLIRAYFELDSIGALVVLRQFKFEVQQVLMMLGKILREEFGYCQLKG